jgi:hypothetical protein
VPPRAHLALCFGAGLESIVLHRLEGSSGGTSAGLYERDIRRHNLLDSLLARG